MNALAPLHLSRVRSGGKVAIDAPDWREFALSDISLGLSRLPRFVGQMGRVVSVLEHSLVVNQLVTARFRLAALLHDAPEFLTGDITRPMRGALGSLIGAAFPDALARIERGAAVAVCRRTLEDSPLALTPEGLAAEAEALADEIDSAEVRYADDSAPRMEMSLDDDLVVPLVRRHYPRHPPDPDHLRSLWFELVLALAGARLTGRSR